MRKKYTWMFCEEFPGITLVQEVAIFYETYLESSFLRTYEKIRLFTLYYRPKYHSFFKSEFVKLPNRLLCKYNGASVTDELLRQLEEIKIHNFNNAKKEIYEFENYQDYLEYQKYKDSLSEASDDLYVKMMQYKEDKNLLPKINLESQKQLIKK